MKEPKDLNIKIGSKEESFWTDVKESTQSEIDKLEKLLKFNKGVLWLAEMKVKESSRKGGDGINRCKEEQK